MLVHSLLNGNKNPSVVETGGLRQRTKYFAASMINRENGATLALPAAAIALNTDNVVLTAIANDRLHDEV